jgi:DNA-binding MarR family transcriptional regulator
MTESLQHEIRQTRPFTSAEQEAHLSVVRTAGLLSDAMDQVLRPAGITGAQYNVLRILRGAEPAGLCRNEVRDRMLTRMPDMTRLLDRMEAAGLVRRTRNAEDRRMVGTHITEKGMALLDSLDSAVTAEHQRQLGHLGPERLRSLIELLAAVRERI